MNGTSLEAHREQVQSWRAALTVDSDMLRSRDFRPRPDALLQRYQIAPEAPAFEVTETVFDENLIDVSAFLQTLRARRHPIHIDHFGTTGYSSFAHIQQLPADALKLDQAFVNDIGIDARHRKMVSAMVSMAHALGMRRIAEGVATAEQLQVLRQLGCASVQGFLLS